MSSVHIYGIKNCDTMKKAFKWLEAHDIEYVFHDYKKTGADKTALSVAIQQHGWDTAINRRGTTWRKLSDDVKSSMDAQGAVTAALENPSLIKRPLLLVQDVAHLGFKEEVYKDIFKR